MKTFYSDDINALANLGVTDSLHVYNGLDVCMTTEIFNAIFPKLDSTTSITYNYSRSLMAPVLEMMLRGVPVDMNERWAMIQSLDAKAKKHASDFEYIMAGAFGVTKKKVVNKRTGNESSIASSPEFHKTLFYQILGLPEQYKFYKGQRTVATDRTALEKLSIFPRAGVLCNILLAHKDATKKRGTLQSGVDADGSFRSSYNICGTETGRFSSNKNAFGTGTNMQNITEELRHIFVAPSGYKLAYVDLEQAESRVTGLLAWIISGKDNYLNACESGDLHTKVVQMMWPTLTAKEDLHDKGKLICPKGTPFGEDKKVNKAIADLQKFYRHFSYRDMSKRCGHASNYYGKPFTVAKNINADTKIVEDFQQAYFSAFPEIPEYHLWTKEQLQTRGHITTPMGRKRVFFGRRDDDATLREAIAYNPQSTIADIENLGILRLWQSNLPVQILMQIHDAVVFQYPEELEDYVLPEARRLLRVELDFNGRKFSIPNDVKTGWNWGKQTETNPDGLKSYDGHDSRQRAHNPTSSFLDRRVP